jgi:two-component system, chemotaxis family, chemotaxis protein CheY
MLDSKLAKLKVLVVDDDSFTASMVAEFLKHGGIAINSIFVARGPADAISILNVQKPGLVITDRIMTPIDGIEFAREIRLRGPDPTVPIIMITGRAEVAGIIAARDAGINELLAKPITMGALFKRINAVFSKPRPFVSSGRFLGPDRRRRADENYAGAQRRSGQP